MNSRILILFLLISFHSFSQQTLTLDEVFSKPELSPKNLKQLQWIPETHFYCWVSDAGDALIQANAENSKMDTLLRSNELIPELKKFPPLNFINQQECWFMFKDEFYLVNFRTKQTILKLKPEEGAGNFDFAVQSRSVVFTQETDLFVQHSGKAIKVNAETDAGILYGQAVHRNEFGIEKGTFWSPSGKKLAFYRMDQRMVTDYPIVHIGTVPAEAKPIKYPMAGGISHHVTLGVFEPSTGKTIYLETGLPEEQYLTNIAWSPDDKFIIIAVVNRGQNEMKLNQYDAASGKFVKTLLTESDPEWVEPEHPVEFVPGSTTQFVYQSEKNGFNHLYLSDLNGTPEIQLTTGNYVVTEFAGFDAKAKNLFAVVTANKAMDRKLIRINLKGKSVELTPLSGTHAIQLCTDKSFFIDTYSSVSVARKVTVNSSSNGKEMRELLSVSNPLAAYTMSIPEILELKTEDGTPLNARIFKPSVMQAGKKYPVVVYVYGGPHAQMVTNRWLAGGNLWMSWLANQGFIVFTLDNRGSGDRGLAFEQAVHRKLGTVEAADQLLGVKYLQSLPFVDSDRIGVHGWSFGGFMTTTLMSKNPGVFKAGVAGGPVMDWKLYEIMYTERYMDTPQENPEGYETANLTNVAANLKDRLLLIHGTVDDVVVWQHSQEFIKKCVDTGVLIDYMIYPEHPHNVQGKDRLHLMKTITRYFQEHL